MIVKPLRYKEQQILLQAKKIKGLDLMTTTH